MPEGPSIILVKEAVKQFTGKKIIAVSGNSKIDQLILTHLSGLAKTTLLRFRRTSLLESSK